MLAANYLFCRWGFEDPAKAQGTEDEVLEAFRRIRDEIAKVFGAYGAGIRLAEREIPSTLL